MFSLLLSVRLSVCLFVGLSARLHKKKAEHTFTKLGRTTGTNPGIFSLCLFLRTLMMKNTHIAPLIKTGVLDQSDILNQIDVLNKQDHRRFSTLSAVPLTTTRKLVIAGLGLQE